MVGALAISGCGLLPAVPGPIIIRAAEVGGDKEMRVKEVPHFLDELPGYDRRLPKKTRIVPYDGLFALYYLNRDTGRLTLYAVHPTKESAESEQRKVKYRLDQGWRPEGLVTRAPVGRTYPLRPE